MKWANDPTLVNEWHAEGLVTLPDGTTAWLHVGIPDYLQGTAAACRWQWVSIAPMLSVWPGDAEAFERCPELNDLDAEQVWDLLEAARWAAA